MFLICNQVGKGWTFSMTVCYIILQMQCHTVIVTLPVEHGAVFHFSSLAVGGKKKKHFAGTCGKNQRT